MCFSGGKLSVDLLVGKRRREEEREALVVI